MRSVDIINIEELKHKEYIKENWGGIGQQKIMKNLNIGYKKLIIYAKELDLEKSQKVAIKGKLSENSINYIRKNYKKMGAKNIAEKLNCAESTVYKYAKDLNLTKACLKWSPKEDEMIRRYINIYSINQVQTMLNREGYNRTTYAIIKRAKDLKIKRNITKNGYYLTTKEVSILMGFSKCKVNNLIRKGYLKGEKYKNKIRINVDHLKVFLFEYQKYWDYKYIDKDYFNLTLLDLNKKDWFLEKIKNDENSDKRKKQYWTTKEVLLLKSLINENTEMEKIYNIHFKYRSKSSIYRKISEIKNKEKYL